MTSTIIRNPDTGCWHILLDSGNMLTWDDRSWRAVVNIFGANTITQDEEGNQLNIVTFADRVEAKIGMVVRQRHIDYVDEVECIKEVLRAEYDG